MSFPRFPFTRKSPCQEWGGAADGLPPRLSYLLNSTPFFQSCPGSALVPRKPFSCQLEAQECLTKSSGNWSAMRETSPAFMWGQSDSWSAPSPNPQRGTGISDSELEALARYRTAPEPSPYQGKLLVHQWGQANRLRVATNSHVSVPGPNCGCG